MAEFKDAELLRIFIGEGDHHDGRPLYEVLVEEARDEGMAGATVLRGIAGFGSHSLIHTSKILRLAEDLPLVLEIVDTTERVEAFLARVEEFVKGGLLTRERVRFVAPGRSGGKDG